MTQKLKTALILSTTMLTLSACGTMGTTTASSSDKSRINAALDRAAASASMSGETSQSVKLLERVYQRDPANEQAAIKYAVALRDGGQPEKSALVLQSFAKAPNASANASREYAATQLELGDYNLGERYARQAIAADSNDAQAWHVLGIALDAKAEHEQAEVAFRKALDMWKGDPVPIMNNLALNLASQNHNEEAIEILKKAKVLAPNRIEVERNLRIISTLNEGA